LEENAYLQRLLPKLSIVNVVATAEASQFINLEELVYVSGFLYDTAIYRCAYLKDKKTKAKVSIFSTGKMIALGSKSYDDAKHDLNYAAKRLVKLGLISPARINVRLQNIVATGDIGHSVDIEKLSAKLPNVIYEPEQFPGAIYYARELEGASILIFASGKVAIAGLRDEHLLEVARGVLAKLGEVS
jgi:transcription initiation factor TFIID TATA-box-binding protein